jgi:N-acetylated-alpha-linked acidic dipeptidase
MCAQTPGIKGFYSADVSKQRAAEKQFDSLLRADQIGRYMRDLTREAHHVASPGGDRNAAYIRDRFTEWGYQTSIETYHVLFPTPLIRQLELNTPKRFVASLREPALPEDATSARQKEQLPVYNCWSADGDVTAELVYVNYGIPADYEKLSRMGISVKGKIVIARYGASWRGIKPKLAQEHGAVGCIIYSDPKEDGYYEGDVYPKGPFRPAFGAQRGSVEDMPVYPGDPLTPGTASTKEAVRLKREEATNLLKIPVIPISHADAQPLLENLGGPVAPTEWRGALPITYHVGPGKNTVRLKLQFDWKIRPVNNIIAKLPGSEFPDEWIIRGNHHDAWVYGAADPVSGLAALMEEARAIGLLAKSGQAPKRSIVYCAWDGEEPGLLGSTEWVEDHAAELQQKAVVYINSDGNGRGFLSAGGSAALEPMVNEVAGDVSDPRAGVSIRERKRANDIINAPGVKEKKEQLERKSISLYPLGAGSDYSPFFQHLGIPSLNLAFSGEDDDGQYHSIYDSYDHFTRFKDSAFVYGKLLSQTAGRITLRCANAETLPFDFSTLQRNIGRYTTEVISLAERVREQTALENQLVRENLYTLADKATGPLVVPAIRPEVPFINFAPLQNAVARLEKATINLHAYLNGKPGDYQSGPELNRRLYRAEQELLLEQGLPRRNWYRHSIYAPGFYTGYGVKTLPGIREAIEQRNWDEAATQIESTAARINKLADHLNSIWNNH